MILNSKIIICAGGNGGNKWNMHLGISKHMIPVHGQPLIHRTQRQFLEKGFTNVYLACSSENRESYLLNGIKYIQSPKCIGHVGENSCVWHYKKHIDYNSTTVITYGDVYYTNEFIDVLSKDPNDKFRIYGRSDKSYLTGNWRQGEPFAIVLTKDSVAKYFKSLKQAMIVLPNLVEKCVACYEDLEKYTYRNFVGIPYEAPGNVVEAEHWYEWNDLTDDIDDPYDWQTRSKLLPHIFLHKLT